MAKLKINLTEEHILLIKNFKIQRFDDIKIGFDTINPYGGNHLMEDLAMILGYWDKTIENTELDYDGRKFGLDNEIEMIKKHSYVVDNFEYIISILIQYSDTGLKPGKYTCIDYQLDWKYEY